MAEANTKSFSSLLSQNTILGALPPLVSLVDVDDLLADLHYGVHVVGIDYRGYVILLGNVADQIVDDHRRLRVETRVGLVAEQIARIEHYGARYGHALYHAAAELRRIETVGARQLHAVQTELHALHFFRLRAGGKQIERQLDILHHGRRVEQRSPLKYHSYILAYGLALLEAERRIAYVVVIYRTRVYRMQPHERLQQHGLARAAAAYDKIGFARIERNGYVVEHGAAVERLRYVFGLYHVSRICVNIRLNIMMTIELATTARVEARPTSSELPSA